MDPDEEVTDGHLHFKMRVSSIHKAGRNVWVCGTWFYAPDELPEFLMDDE
jgi:hypothetical protein